MGSYKSVGRGSESSMQSYVSSTGPLSVCVDANSWNSYRSGIMTSCGTSIDHCVQIVGYGSYGSYNYWKVRNSWGRNWGESGHMRLQIGRNLCRINNEPTAVTISAVGPSPTPTPTPTPSPSPSPSPTPSYPTCDTSSGGVICTCTTGCGLQAGQTTPCVAPSGTDCSGHFSGATCCSRPACLSDRPICTCHSGCGLGLHGSSPCACASGTDCGGSFSGCTCCNDGSDAVDDFISKLYEHSLGGHTGGDLSASLLGGSGNEPVTV